MAELERSLAAAECKACSRCGEAKALSEFATRRLSADGRTAACKICIRRNRPARSAEQRRQERVRRLARKGRTYIPLAERKVTARKRRLIGKWRLAVVRQRHHRRLTADRPWLVGVDQTERYRLRYALDPAFAESQRQRAMDRRRTGACYHLGTRMKEAIVRNRDSDDWRRVLGCSIGYLKRWIEAQFREGMDWAKYEAGLIQIDHIRPLCSFDLFNEVEFRRAWHYTNLQPLWAHENMVKGRRMPSGTHEVQRVAYPPPVLGSS